MNISTPVAHIEKKSFNLKKLLSISLSLLLFSDCFSQTAISSGDWSNPAIWSPGIPAAGAAVTINSGVTVTMSDIRSCGTLTISGTLTVLPSATVSFTAGRSIILNATGVFDMTNQTVTATGALTINNNGGGSGSFTATGSTLTFSAGATFIVNGTQTTTFNNINFNNNAVVFNMTKAPIINGMLTTNAAGSRFNNNSPTWGPNSTLNAGTNTLTSGTLWVAGVPGIIGITPGYPNNVTIAVAIAGLPVVSTNVYSLAGTFSLVAGTNFPASTISTLFVGGGWSKTAGSIPNIPLVVFDGVSAQNIAGAAVTVFNNVTIANPTITLLQTMSVAGTLSILNGTLDAGSTFFAGGAGTATVSVPVTTTPTTLTTTAGLQTATIVSNAGLVVGMTVPVSSGVPANTVITSISGGNITLSQAATSSGAVSTAFTNVGTLKTSNVNGIASSGASGSIQTTTRNYNAGNYEFYGTAAITSYAPPSANNLTINNTATGNAVTLTSATNIAGSLILTNGILLPTTVTITNTAPAGVSGGSTTSFVNGPLNWVLPGSLSGVVSYTFPVGATTYLPFAFNPVTGASVTATVRGYNAGTGGSLTGYTFSITEYWTLLTSGLLGAGSTLTSLQRYPALIPMGTAIVENNSDNMINSSTGYVNIGGSAGGTNTITGTGPSIGNTLFTSFFSLAVVSPPAVTSATTASGTETIAFTFNITATNSPTSYAIASGILPTGLTLNTVTGAITGTPVPSAAGTYVLTVTATNAGGTSPATNLTITIAAATPGVTLNHTGLAQTGNGNIFRNTSDNIVSNFTMTVSSYSATLNALTFTGTGNFLAGDITAFNLYTNTTATISGATLVSTVNATALIGTSPVTFSSFSQVCPVGTRYFFITADVSVTATLGRTVIVPAAPALTFAVTPSPYSNGATAGGTKTIAGLPVITLDHTGIAQTTASNITQGSVNNILSNFRVNVTTVNATLNALTFTGTGNFAAGDLVNYKLYTKTTSSFPGATLLGTVSAVSYTGTSTITFSSLTQACNVGTDQFFWITADVGTGVAAIGKTVIVPAAPNLTFAGGSVTNNITVGGTKTITAGTPVITVDHSTIAQTTAGVVLRSSVNNILSNFRVNVTTADAFLNTLSFVIGGNFVAGDLTNIKLYTSTSNSFPGGAALSTVVAGAFIGGTSTVTFSSLGQACVAGTDRFFWITADIAIGATLTKTISVPATPAFTFASGTVTNSVTVGGVKTISAGKHYYNVVPGTTAANLTSTWTTDQFGGAGVAPANFISGDTFTIRATTVVTTNAAWIVSGGPATRIEILGTLTLSNPLNINGSFGNSGTFNHGNQTVTFGTYGDIGGTNASIFFNLTINTTATTDIVTLTRSGAGIVNTGTLALTTGIFKIGTGNQFFVGTNAGTSITATGGATSGFATTGTNGSDGGTILIDSSGGSGNTCTINSTGLLTFYNLQNGKLVGNANTTLSITNPGTIKINGTLTFLDNNASISRSPVYGPASTLYWNRCGQAYNAGSFNEWNATSGYIIGTTLGYPNNVTIVNAGNSNGTYNGLNVGVAITTAVSINGTLTLGDAAAVYNGTAYAGIAGINSGSFFCGGIVINNNSAISATSSFTDKGNWLRQGATIGIFLPGTNTVTFGGSGTSVAPQTIDLSTGTESSFYNIAITNGTYVKLNKPVTLPVAGIISLISGIVETSVTNLLYITNTGVAGITGLGTSTTYINGAVKWNVALSQEYTFPLGKSTVYLPFSVTPAMAAANTLTAEAFNSNSGGLPDGFTVTSISSTEYWSLSATGSFSSGAAISAGRISGVGANNMLAKSTTAAGIYSAIGGASGAVGSITGMVNGNAGNTSPWFVALAYGPLSITTVTVTHPSTCLGITVGAVTVSGSGGVPPYKYDVDGGTAFTNTTGVFSNLAAGTHTFTVKDATGATRSISALLQQLTVTADTAVCPGSSIQLLASGAGTTYTWSPATELSSTTIANPVATPTATRTYTVTANIISTTNLIINPGFESGTTTNSDYNNHTGGAMNSSIDVYGNPHNGIYKITSNPQSLINSFLSFPPHTGNGMMVIDGPLGGGYTNQRVWYQAVTGLTTGKQYIFSYWVTNVSGSAAAPAQIRTNIDGTDVGTSTVPFSGWTQVSYTFTAAAASVTINLYDMVQADVGNDFALDDLSVYQTCTDSKNVTLTVSGTEKTWLGVTSSDWFTASNWCGGVPTIADNANIPVVAAMYPYPVINSTGAVAKNIVIASGASVTITNAGNLALKGLFNNSGTFTNNGELIFNSSTIAQSFPGATGVLAAMKDLTVNNTLGITFNRNFSIYGALTPTAGNINVNNVYVTLTSTATTTARAGVVGTSVLSYTGTGKFVVERYYPGRRKWRLITAPVVVDGTKTIFNSWQVGGNNSLTGSGTYVSGAGANPSANGLDVSPLNNSSLKTFNYTNSSFTAVPNTLTPLISGLQAGNTSSLSNLAGYFMFVRGDRTAANVNAFNPYGSVLETTLRDTGTLKTGLYKFDCNPGSGANKYTLIGNPYASPVDFAAISKTNVLNKFWAWDPNLSGSEGVGGYVILDITNGTVTRVPLTSTGTISQAQYIQSSQAFLVETDIVGGPAPSVTFNESNKSANNNLGLFRPAGNNIQVATLAANIFLREEGGNRELADGVVTQFDRAFSRATDKLDAAKFTNVNETFSIAGNNTYFSLERRPLLTERDTLFYTLARTSRRNYSFNIYTQHFTQNNLAAFLEDSYLKTRTRVNMNGDTWVNFSITADPGSTVKNRFRIVFKKLARCTAINANIVNNDIEVDWDIAGEYGNERYEIERSQDGIAFELIGNRAGDGISERGKTYSWLDIKPVQGVYYYRIKCMSDDDISYSNIVKVLIAKAGQSVYIFPNPVVGDRINLQMSRMPAGIYIAKLLNNAGQVMQVNKISHAAGSGIEVVPVTTAIDKAVYNLELTGPANYFINLKVLF